MNAARNRYRELATVCINGSGDGRAFRGSSALVRIVVFDQGSVHVRRWRTHKAFPATTLGVQSQCNDVGCQHGN